MKTNTAKARFRHWVDIADILPNENDVAKIIGCAVGTIWGRVSEFNAEGYTIERTKTAILVHARPKAETEIQRRIRIMESELEELRTLANG